MNLYKNLIELMIEVMTKNIQLIKSNIMKKLHILLPTILCVFSCEKFLPIDRKYNTPVSLYNNSKDTISRFIDDIDWDKTPYPDTSITEETILMKGILPSKIDILYFEENLQNQFSKYPNDTICLFILNTNTIKNNPWDSIRSRYNILARYDLSSQDIINRNFKIEYPYDSSLGKLKVWQKM